jgi:hypothetical protein
MAHATRRLCLAVRKRSSLKRGCRLLADLRTLIEERNRWAHGARPATRLRRLQEWSICISRWSAASRSVSSWQTSLGSLRRLSRIGDVMPTLRLSRSVRWEIILSSNAVDWPRPRPWQTTPSMRLVHEGLLTSLLVVIRYCQTCRQREMFYADRLDEMHGVALKSFTTGHVIFDGTLVEQVISPVSATHDDTSTG